MPKNNGKMRMIHLMSRPLGNSFNDGMLMAGIWYHSAH